MKKLLILLLNLFVCYCCYSQLPINSVNLPDSSRYNFYDIRNQILENSTTLFTDLEDEDGAYVQFKRWEWFWGQRLYPSGDFNVAGNAIRNYASPPIVSPVLSRGRQTPQLKSLSYPANWRALGPFGKPNGTSFTNGAGRLQRIAFDPNMPNDSIYVASPMGGLWKSHNNGSNLVFRNLNTDQLPLCGVADVAIDPNDGDTIFIAMGDGDDDHVYSIGMYRSADGGATWVEVNSGLWTGITSFRLIKKILMHPTNANIIFIATNHGVWKTTNALTTCTWSRVCGADNVVFRGLAFKPGDPTTVYASSQAIYKSTSSGNVNTWNWGGTPFYTPTFTGKTVTLINIDVTNASGASSYLYAYIFTRVDTSDAAVPYFQKYNGSNWLTTATTIPSTTGGFSETWLPLECSPTHTDTIYLGTTVVRRSTDGGASFPELTLNSYYSTTIHPDIHDLKFSPDNTKIYAATDGGLYRSSNPRATTPTWTAVCDSLAIGTLYGLSQSQSDTNIIMMGELDLGSNLYDNTGSPTQPWKIVQDGDGFDPLIDRLCNDTMYSTYYNNLTAPNRFKKTLNAWSSSSSAGYPSGAWISEWVQPYLQNENNNKIYVGYEELYRTSNFFSTSPNWDTLSDFRTDFSSGNCTAIKSFAVSALNPNYIYVATRGVTPYLSCDVVSPRLFMTSVGGGLVTGWSEMTPPDIAEITGIAIHPDDPTKIWITYSGYTTDKVKYYNGSTWSSYSTGLPAMPINCITYERGSADGLYVGTDVGVYYRNKNMSSWEKYNEGLPNVIINELEIMYKHNKLRAATFGRGLWESPLACPTNYDITLSGAHAFDYFYEAENNISSTATIANGRTITYRAGNEIALTSGFGVASGGEFAAFIHPCDHGGNSFNKTDETENSETELIQMQSNININESKITVYPNPNKGEFTLNIGGNMSNVNAILIIRDIAGREIFQTIINKSQTILDLTNQKAGIYFLELNHFDGKTERTKVIKE